MKKKLKEFCTVGSCQNYYSQDYRRPNLFFYIFPKGREHLWAKAIGKPDLTFNGIKSSRRVCSDHFREEDFNGRDNYGRKRLTKDAIPSLLLNLEDKTTWRKRGKKKAQNKERDEDDDEEEETKVSEFEQVVREEEEEVEYQQDDETVTVEPCIICAKTTDTIWSANKYQFPGSLECNLLNEQLWSTFILRQVLELPSWKFEDILKTAGKSIHPGSWLSVCHVCSKSVVQIMEVEEKIRNLHEEINKLKKMLRRKFRNCLKTGHLLTSASGVLNVRKEIINSFHNVKVEPYESPNDQSRDEFDEPWEDEDDHDMNSKSDTARIPCVLPARNVTARKRKNSDDDDEWEPNAESDCSWTSDQFDHTKAKIPLTPTPTLSKRSKNMISTPVAKKTTPVAKKGKTPEQNVPKEFPCSKCSMSFANAPGLKRHAIRIHKEAITTEKDVCDICGFVAIGKGVMKSHVFNHKIFDNSVDPSVSSVEFICNICKQLFRTRMSLLHHKVDIHAKELDLKVVSCPDCSRNFLKKSELLYHQIKLHNARTDHQCDKCSYQAINRKTLDIHMAKHSEAPAICQYCSATYTYLPSLREHIRRYHPEKYEFKKRNTFTGVSVEKLPSEGDAPTWTYAVQRSKKLLRPITCKYCDATLPHRLAFNLHLKEAHKDLYKFKCQSCDKAYITPSNLKLHEAVSHSETSHRVKCGWCLTSVVHRAYLYAHSNVCPKRPINEEGTPRVFAIEDVEDKGTTGTDNAGDVDVGEGHYETNSGMISGCNVNTL